MSVYVYSIATDTLSAKVASVKLSDEILNSSIIPVLDRIDTDSDNLNIYFDADLSAGEQTTLGSLVGAHDGIPYPGAIIPLEVKTQLEKGEIKTKMARVKGTLDANGYIEIDITVPTDGRLVKGGSAWFDTFHADSTINVEIHHPIAGFLDSYSDNDLPADNQGWFVDQAGEVKVVAMDFFGSLPGGLIMKIKAQHGSGAAASGESVRCNIQWGEISV